MKKITLLIGIIGILLINGCSSKQQAYDDCMMGCFAGLNYNGSEILEVDIDNIDEEQLNGFVTCENFCEIYVVRFKKENQ